MWDSAPSLSKLQEAIADSSLPIGMRMRAAYFLRQSHANASANCDELTQQIVIDTLSKGLLDPSHGSLMRHEFAYVMGQMKDERSCQTLQDVLLTNHDCVMVRHEAAEALGAISAQTSMPVLETVMLANLDTPELSDTCRLALNYIQWKQRGDNNGDNSDSEEDPHEPPACACMLSPYSSVDPAPPHPKHISLTYSQLGNLLMDPNQPIFERYRAMFSLRNRGGPLAVHELCVCLVQDESSALLRHEVAYVLGQMQHPSSIDALAQSLRRPGEHEMVRHESAEALGAIDGGRWQQDVQPVLKEFLNDENVVVRESCLVALDAADYWGHSTNNNSTREEEERVLSFVKQKAVANSKQQQGQQALETRYSSTDSSAGTEEPLSVAPNRILINHFNVKH